MNGNGSDMDAHVSERVKRCGGEGASDMNESVSGEDGNADENVVAEGVSKMMLLIEMRQRQQMKMLLLC